MKEYRLALDTGIEVSRVAHGIAEWLGQEKDMTVRVYHLESGKYVIHARDIHSDRARLFGLDRAVCISLTSGPVGIITAVVNGGAWRDKVIAASISLLMLWPLMLTSAWGACSQLRVFREICRRLREYE